MLFVGITASRADQFISAHTTVSLIADKTTIVPGESFNLGVKFSLEPGWHLYWKNPGDSGKAPKIEFEPIKGVMLPNDFLWPTPKRIPYNKNFVNYGYEKEVLLPLTASLSSGFSQPSVTISAQVRWIICKENCIPGQAELSRVFSVGPKAVQGSNYGELSKAITHLPVLSSAITTDVIDNDSSITVVVHSEKELPRSMIFFPLTPGIIENAAPQSILAENNNTISISLVKRGLATVDNDSFSGVLFAEEGFKSASGAKAIEVSGKAQKTSSLISTDVSYQHILAILFSAFFGGLILNLMPCVFPVLSFKALSFLQAGNAHREKVVRNALIYTFGVVVSFAVLGLGVLVAKQAGMTLGWGFQLQNPYFVLFSIFLLELIALNFFGVYHLGFSVQCTAGKVQCKETPTGTFLSGVLATLLASPCTAPFMGSAIAAALGLPLLLGILVFIVLGLGMASPFLLFALVPSLGRFLPKPGHWMETLRNVLGFPLVIACVWLVWVLGAQQGNDAVGKVLVALIFVGFAAWLYGKLVTAYSSNAQKLKIDLLCGVIIIATYMWAIPTKTSVPVMSNDQAQVDAYGNTWIPYSKNIVDELRAQHRSVYIDFTAAWCITCQVNKRVVFSSDEVKKILEKNNVALVRADWTSADPVVTEGLHSFGREGVPLNVFYPIDHAKEPIILPALLTPSVVIGVVQDNS